MDNHHEMNLRDIEQSYPDEWVLVEETAWDEHGNPVCGIVRVHNRDRENLSDSLKEIHRGGQAKTFVFYTGELIPEYLALAL